MSDNAEISMALYKDLLPEEKNKLMGIENDVLRVLLDHGLSARPIWTSGTDATGRRVVKLLLLAAKSQPRVVFELPSSELEVLSYDELLSRLNESIRQL